MGGRRGVIGKIGEESSRNMYEGHMDKAKGGRIEGGVGWGGVGGRKWRQPYFNNNLENKINK